jgi:hypothetical protein
MLLTITLSSGSTISVKIPPEHLEITLFDYMSKGHNIVSYQVEKL